VLCKKKPELGDFENSQHIYTEKKKKNNLFLKEQEGCGKCYNFIQKSMMEIINLFSHFSCGQESKWNYNSKGPAIWTKRNRKVGQNEGMLLGFLHSTRQTIISW
jgi:hypothetical protein